MITAEQKAEEYLDKFNGDKKQATELVCFHIDYISNLPYKARKRFDRKNRIEFWNEVKQYLLTQK